MLLFLPVGAPHLHLGKVALMNPDSQPKVAIAAKDFMSARVLAPIVEELVVRGAHIELYLEGHAAGEPFCILPALKAHKGERLDPSIVLDQVRMFSPDVLMVGSSTSDNGIDSIERLLVREARWQGSVKTVCVPDYWGAERRLMAPVDLALVIDEEAARITGEARTAVRTEVIGDFVSLDAHRQRRNAEPILDALRAHTDPERTLLITGQGKEYLPDMMRLAIECLAHSPGWRLIPYLFHPKKGPDEVSARLWSELSRQHGDRILSLDHERFPVDALAVTVGATLSGFSTVLRYASASGKLALAANTDAVRKGRERSTGLADYPPALGQEAIALTHAIDLSTAVRSHPQPRPFKPDYAAQCTLALCP